MESLDIETGDLKILSWNKNLPQRLRDSLEFCATVYYDFVSLRTCGYKLLKKFYCIYVQLNQFYCNVFLFALRYSISSVAVNGKDFFL